MTTEDATSHAAWNDLLVEAESLATDLRDRGWTILNVTPDTVTPVASECGFILEVPEETFENVRDLLETTATIEAAQVYYHTTDETTYALAVERDDTNGVAVLLTLYYDLTGARPVLESAFERGQLMLYVQTASTTQSVAFSHDDPSLFFDGDAVDWNPR